MGNIILSVVRICNPSYVLIVNYTIKIATNLAIPPKVISENVNKTKNEKNKTQHHDIKLSLKFNATQLTSTTCL
jgi:hypothetical protein